MITISESASEKVKEMLSAQENTDLFLRIGVKEGGCSGLSYGIGFDPEKTDNDDEFDVDGLKVVVDAQSGKFIDGLEIGYQESAMGGGFTMHNPNAVASCGCGSSFRTKEYAGKAEEC